MAQQSKTSVKSEAPPSAPSSSYDEDKKMHDFLQLRKDLRERMMHCENMLSQAGTPTRSLQGGGCGSNTVSEMKSHLPAMAAYSGDSDPSTHHVLELFNMPEGTAGLPDEQRFKLVR